MSKLEPIYLEKPTLLLSCFSRFMTPPLTGTASFLPCWTDSETLPIGDWNAETGEGRESVEVATRPVKVVPLPSLGVTGSITVTSSSLSSLLLDSSLLDSVMYVVL